MTFHDWTRVPAGIFHHFHTVWIAELSNWLNGGNLPADYYAVGEQRIGTIEPDVLTLHSDRDAALGSPADETLDVPRANGSVVAVAEVAPKVQRIISLDRDLAFYASRQRQMSIRHVSNDELIAIIEIVSPANKHSEKEISRLIDKVDAVIRRGIHVMLIDPFPPSNHDLYGLPMKIIEILGQFTERALLPSDRNRSLASFDAGEMTAYIQPLGIGELISPMPLFLRPGHYLNVDLQLTYDEAFRFFPERFKRVLSEQG